jgi:hypothetical protein
VPSREIWSRSARADFVNHISCKTPEQNVDREAARSLPIILIHFETGGMNSRVCLFGKTPRGRVPQRTMSRTSG